MHAGRPLTSRESAVLEFMLTAEFPGVEALREQAKTARVLKTCDCGCPSFDIWVDREGTPPALESLPGVVAEAVSRDERFTHLLLWVDGDHLGSVELSWLEMPSEMPPPSAFETPRRFRHGS